MKNTILFLFLILLTACQNETTNYTDLNFYGENQRQYVLDNNIKEIEYYRFELDVDRKYNNWQTIENKNPKATEVLWKRLEYKEIFDKNGLLIYKIEPKYLTKKYEKTENMSVEELEEFLINIKTSTNIPIGIADTTYFYYDKKGRLIKEKNKIFTVTNKYDDKDSLIEWCVESDRGETNCHYKIYTYKDGSNEINYVRDSLGRWNRQTKEQHNSAVESSKIKMFYKYDEYGRILFDGTYFKKYNQNNQLISLESYNRDSDTSTLDEKHILKYDEHNNLVRIELIDAKPKFEYVKNESFGRSLERTGVRIDTSYTFNLYNDKNLKTEIQEFNSSNNLTKLMKLKYTFYED